ncbi:MAG: hypothetical protein E7417_00235 [Ruminococcaceae bacterium]|nr:hypothetical protein [Oscillospiraceae bacterium]
MRKSHIITVIILVVLAVATSLLTLTEKEETQSVMNTALYFFSSDKSTIVETEKEISYESREDLFQKTAQELLKGPSGKKYNPIMDKGIKINSLSYKDRVMSIDFSEEYKKETILTTYAVVKTMSQFSDVEKVLVTSEGMNIIPGDGMLSGEEINLESDDDCSTGMNLYYANKEKDKLVREYRKINIDDTQPVERYIVNELIKGPKNENNQGLLSTETGVISVETTDGTCYVNFKKDFISKNTSSSNIEALIVYSLVNSLTEREHIKNVQFLIEGKKTEQFGNMDISRLYYRDDTYIETY